MAKRLQIIGDFPSDSKLDEEAVKQIVADHLTENPPVAKLTINGIAPDENGNITLETLPEGSSNAVDF